MSLKTFSDDAAIVAGIATTSAFVIAGCSFVGAMVAGAIVAAAIDVTFGSITEASYHGPVHQKQLVRNYKPPVPKPILSRFSQ